ncbi:MAG: iron-sulfur cluster assembly protein [Armatimonadota bacterium]|nr:iron-sulfur cluster assembly protein [Armatimonadota bacterium]MDR7519383.1 iron-sulfur cluster assembly protein [Armatimonadota bacterium]MDR7549494.1 iron-sulfur cluster assembly protein [Armatimonadota bacterium]
MDEVITREQVIDVLRTVFDPEIPVNVWDLGLIYDLQVAGEDVAITMTLTAPGCPVGPMIAAEIENKLQAIGAEKVSVSFVWMPPWTTDRVTPEGKLQLQMMGIPV